MNILFWGEINKIKNLISNPQLNFNSCDWTHLLHFIWLFVHIARGTENGIFVTSGDAYLCIKCYRHFSSPVNSFGLNITWRGAASATSRLACYALGCTRPTIRGWDEWVYTFTSAVKRPRPGSQCRKINACNALKGAIYAHPQTVLFFFSFISNQKIQTMQ